MRLTIKVIPRSSTNEIIGEMADGTLKIKVTSPPVDGAANEAVIGLLSKKYKVAKSTIRIIKGETSKIKIVELL